MEFRDLKAQYKHLKDKIDKAVTEVMTEATFIGGKKVQELEEKLSDYIGVKHAITCGNGTDSLQLILMALGIKEGDAVFVPDFTFFATAEVVSYLNATPVFVDVDELTFNMDSKSLEKAILEVIKEGKLKPKVIIPVDLFGLPADYDAISEIASKYNLEILEDAAQGFGGEYKGKKAGSFGIAASTSFFPAKPLGCYGDGGAIFTNDDDLATLIRSLAVHGKGTDKYDNVRIGINSRLDTIQAAILLVKFEAFKEFELEKVNEVANFYTNQLKDKVITPIVPEGYFSSWAQYTIQLKDKEQRDQIQNKLKGKNIPSMIYYSKPLHKQTAFNDIKKYIETPTTKILSEKSLSLPINIYSNINKDLLNVLNNTIF